SATIRYFYTSSLLDAVRSVSVPPFAESVTEGDIIWKKAVGERVREDEVVAEIETDKTNVPVPAPCSGVVTELLVDDGGKVVPGQEIFKLDDAATGVAAEKKSEAKAPAAAAAAAAPSSKSSEKVPTEAPEPLKSAPQVTGSTKTSCVFGSV
ncbi:Dihydrolipoyllysine-residue succinyltransferase, partial [Fasciola gigantica]